jgi:hypothetical protein
MAEVVGRTAGRDGAERVTTGSSFGDWDVVFAHDAADARPPAAGNAGTSTVRRPVVR